MPATSSAPLPWWQALGLPTAAAMLWKVSAVALPPHGEHAWRDATGISVARGFLHESWNLLAPRVADRGSGSGVAGMELPLVPWASAALMRLVGESYFAARLPVWLSLVPLAWAALALGRRVLGNESGARIGAACVVLQPLVVIFSHKLMPEIPMLSLILAGAAWAIDGLRGSWPKALLGAASLALGAVLMPTGPAIAIPIAAILIAELQRPDLSRSARAGVAMRAALVASAPALAVALWFAYARAVSDATGFAPIKLHQDWWEWTHLVFDGSFLAVVFGRILHLYLLWPTVLWMAWRWRTALAVLQVHPVLPAWIVGSMAVVVLYGSHNFQHSYYAIPATVPFAFWAGDFAAREASFHSHPARLLVGFLAVFAITSAIRTWTRFPGIDYDPTRLSAAVRSVPHEEPALVTDGHSPVVSLVILDRTGWGVPANSLTPAAIESYRAQGAKQLLESSFGGWLSDESRAALPPPAFSDDQVRIYRLQPRP